MRRALRIALLTWLVLGVPFPVWASTQVFLLSTNSFVSPYLKTDTARGAFISTSITSTGDGPVTLQWTKTAGGSIAKWLTPPIHTGFTMSGNVTLNIWDNSFNGEDHKMMLEVRLAPYTGSVGSTFMDSSEGVNVTNSSATDHTWTGTPTSQAFNAGDRIEITGFITDFTANTMTAGGQNRMRYNGPDTGSSGDTYLTFTETFTFDGDAPLTPTPTVTFTPDLTPTPTLSPTPTATATKTPTPTPTRTAQSTESCCILHSSLGCNDVTCQECVCTYGSCCIDSSFPPGTTWNQTCIDLAFGACSFACPQCAAQPTATRTLTPTPTATLTASPTPTPTATPRNCGPNANGKCCDNPPCGFGHTDIGDAQCVNCLQGQAEGFDCGTLDCCVTEGYCAGLGGANCTQDSDCGNANLLCLASDLKCHGRCIQALSNVLGVGCGSGTTSCKQRGGDCIIPYEQGTSKEFNGLGQCITPAQQAGCSSGHCGIDFTGSMGVCAWDQSCADIATSICAESCGCPVSCPFPTPCYPGNAACFATPTPTSTGLTPTRTPTVSPTPTKTATPTPTFTPSGTKTATPVQTATKTKTPTPTRTPTSGATSTPNAIALLLNTECAAKVGTTCYGVAAAIVSTGAGNPVTDGTSVTFTSDGTSTLTSPEFTNVYPGCLSTYEAVCGHVLQQHGVADSCWTWAVADTGINTILTGISGAVSDTKMVPLPACHTVVPTPTKTATPTRTPTPTPTVTP